MPKQLINSAAAPTTGFTDATKPAPIAQAGADFRNVVNMRVILRDTADFARFNEVFREILDGEKVTRTCVGATPHRTGVNVEIDCVAMFD
jgi:2-iminobutanoate/2-iminopropanoate deaminase